MARQRRSAPAPAANRRAPAPAPARPAAAPAPAARPASAPASNVPAPTHAAQPMPMGQQPTMMQPQGPGLMANIASTAAGVAIGHTVGHALTGAASSMFGGSSEQAPPQPEPQPASSAAWNNTPMYNQGADPAQAGPCGWEFQQFMKCLQNSGGDVNACAQLQDTLQQCKWQNGLH